MTHVQTLFAAVLICCSVASGHLKMPNPSLDAEWTQFKVTYNKQYEGAYEELMRRYIFEENYRFIEEHNANPGDKDFVLGMNHFGDLTNKEYRDTYLGYRPPQNTGADTPMPESTFVRAAEGQEVPDSIDWRTKDCVTEVKDQGQCGSCWAFSAVGSLEGQHARATGKLTQFSEQNLVDCSGPEGNFGCNGGWMDQAFQYVKDNKGLDTEDSYPYLAQNDQCHFNPKTVGVTVRGYMDVRHGDEEALRQAVGTKGPVSVAIDASSSFFQFYRGGVFNLPWCSTTDLDHGVLVVGYGRQFQGKQFWMVKNSWGTGWGIYGYIEMSRNKHNQCGIATNASIPIV